MASLLLTSFAGVVQCSDRDYIVSVVASSCEKAKDLAIELVFKEFKSRVKALALFNSPSRLPVGCWYQASSEDLDARQVFDFLELKGAIETQSEA